MSSNKPCNRWIFREGKISARGERVRAGLASALAKLRHPTRDGLVDALIRAGELETALADAGSEQARTAAEITNAVAAALVGLQSVLLESTANIVAEMPVLERIDISVPEGFAYYALHPLSYVDLVEKLQLPSRHAAVIGIRSIGSTLSAVVAAACVRNNIRAERITVRPAGHPYDRKTHFTSAELRWIADARHYNAEFLVVDEGPGLSGSSFLSVGEALLAAGVERRRIRFLCSHEVNPESLTAPNAAERWRGFQSYSVGLHRPPTEGLIDVSAGKWRAVFAAGEDIPSWVHMERVKFLSADRTRLLKFAGLGRYGEEVACRAERLAASGFGPKFFGVHDGYAELEMVNGRPMRREQLSRAVIEQIAEYCAMLAVEFAVTAAAPSILRPMTRYNYEQEFGEPAPDWTQLDHPARMILCDGRMQPHEWVKAADGTIIKTDGDTHGDDHFLPGPTDIAWDLAGAIVEWEMDADAEEALLARYASLTGDDPRGRIDAYIAAYAVFRSSYCTMAAHALRGTREEEGLQRAAARYRRSLQDRVETPEAA